jgi:hypothetical protein
MTAPLLSGIFVALALLHFYWAAGGGGGLDGFVPSEDGKPLLTPGPLASLLVGVALLAAALVVTCRAGMWCVGLPAPLARVGIWVIALLFALRAIGEFRYVGFFKRVRGSRFARRDTWIFSPLCVVIAVLATRLGMAP